MNKINNINTTFHKAEGKSQVKGTNDNSKINIFETKNKPNEPITNDEFPKEFHLAMKLIGIVYNQDVLEDGVLLAELENLKDYNISDVLDYYLTYNDGKGLLDDIETSPYIKTSTKNKFKNYFKKTLEQFHGFDPKYKDKGNQTQFKSENYEYKSDIYNVVQKNDDILEIENTKTKEKRTINFKEILPQDLNGMNDTIALKSSIQKLPAEILFQIPEEISLICSTFIFDAITANNPDVKVDYDGAVYPDPETEFVVSSEDPTTLIHEIAHCIFHNSEGNDVLTTNPKIKEIYDKAVKGLQDDDNAQWDEDETYWSTNISEFGAEVLTAVFEKDYRSYESIKKYAPEAFAAIMEIYEERKTAPDRHNHFNYEDLEEEITEPDS